MPKRKAIKVDPAKLQEDEMALTYELGYLIVPRVEAEALPEQIGALRGSIERAAGVPFSEESPTLRELAYRISRSLGGHREHFKEAYFGSVKFDALPRNIDLIRQELAGNEKILRHLIVKVPRDTAVADKTTSIRPVVERKKDKVAPSDSEKASVVEEKKGITDEELDKTIQELLGE